MKIELTTYTLRVSCCIHERLGALISKGSSPLCEVEDGIFLNKR